MKYLSVVFLLLFIIFKAGFAQNIDENYEVATWKDFKKAAISYTFDDNTPNQLEVAIPIFDEYGFSATLFTITNVSWAARDWEGLRAAAENGHEIASHTETHVNFGDLSDEDLRDELANSKKTIEENIPGYTVSSLAYPFCAPGNNAIVAEYYFVARGCSGQVEPSSPSAVLNISSIIVGSEGSVTSTSNLNARVDAAVAQNGWAVFLLHGIDGDGGYSDMSSDEIEGNLKYLQDNDEDFWVETFGNVAKYYRERDAVSIEETLTTDNKIEFELTDGLEDSVYNFPITIRRVLPDGWDSTSATQNLRSLEVDIVEMDAVKYAMFNAIPDSDTVVLEKALVTSMNFEGTDRPESNKLIRNYPNPFNPTTNIVYEVEEAGLVEIEIYDMLGKKLEILVNERKNPGEYITQWNASDYVSGTYIYRYANGALVQQGQMVLVK